MVYKGTYQVKNRQKYRGDPSKLKFRSSWEFSVCKWCDENPKIIKWNFEGIHIPYKCTIENKMRKYIVDFWIKFYNDSEYLLEIKPKKQTQAPIKPKRLTPNSKKNYIYESYLWQNNQDKWIKADIWAKKHNMKFIVMHEDTLQKQLGIKIHGKQERHNKSIKR